LVEVQAGEKAKGVIEQMKKDLLIKDQQV